MAKLTKRQKAIAEKVGAGKQYSFEEAAKLLAELSTIKFKEDFKGLQHQIMSCKGIPSRTQK
ncbi:50S ribosomal protein L1 [Pseudomonas aeruginosa MPAO1/P2]|nr:50S ribosomal protein L1 [Pseudomonas aeruginosa MPAO1/P2]